MRRARLRAASFDVYVISVDGGRPNVVARGPKEQLFPASATARSCSGHSSRASPFRRRRADAGTPQSGPRELLPDFDQRAPFRLAVAGTKLGFASATDNIGEGPVWVRGSRPAAAGPMIARQLVRLTDGTARTYDDAGRLRYTYSPTHTHWHLLDFQRYELRTLDDELVVRDRKSGFCLADHYGLARRRVVRFTGARLLRQLRRVEPAGARRRAGNVDRLHGSLSAALPRPEPRAPRRPGRDLRAGPPREPDPAARGDRLHEQLRLAPHPPHLDGRRRLRSRRSGPARARIAVRGRSP